MQMCVDQATKHVDRPRLARRVGRKKVRDLLAIALAPPRWIKPHQQRQFHRIANRRAAVVITFRSASSSTASAVAPDAVSRYGRRGPSAFSASMYLAVSSLPIAPYKLPGPRRRPVMEAMSSWIA